MIMKVKVKAAEPKENQSIVWQQVVKFDSRPYISFYSVVTPTKGKWLGEIYLRYHRLNKEVNVASEVFDSEEKAKKAMFAYAKTLQVVDLKDKLFFGSESKTPELKVGSYIKLGDKVLTQNKLPLDKGTVCKVTKLTKTQVFCESPDDEVAVLLKEKFPFQVIK